MTKDFAFTPLMVYWDDMLKYRVHQKEWMDFKYPLRRDRGKRRVGGSFSW
jgi:hypothetical protein